MFALCIHGSESVISNCFVLVAEEKKLNPDTKMLATGDLTILPFLILMVHLHTHFLLSLKSLEKTEILLTFYQILQIS